MSRVHIIVFIIAFIVNINADNDDTVNITAQVFADNYFKFWFNGELIFDDTSFFRPVQFFQFEAPLCGKRTFSLQLRDYGNTVGSLLKSSATVANQDVPVDDLICIGGGGFRGFFEDTFNDIVIGTNDNWKCYVLSSGPVLDSCFTESEIAAFYPPNTLQIEGYDFENTGTIATHPDSCIINVVPDATCCREDYFFHTYDADWFLPEYVPSNDKGWEDATIYPTDVAFPSFGSVPWFTDYTQCGKDTKPTWYCSYDESDWKGSEIIWSSDLEFDNTVLCRYEYEQECDSSSDSSSDDR